jgi:hypothetical protein
MEVLLALTIFAWVGTALASAMHSIGKISTDIRKQMILTRILDSELREAMSVPQLEEGTTEESLDEGQIDIVTVVTPIEDLLTVDGTPLQEMYRIQVIATWWDGREYVEEMVETWRYGRLYQQ